jgi:uncharacterized protein YceH (UPF0502 family)
MHDCPGRHLPAYRHGVMISLEGGRVLGCLVEKQLTTPQQYPLSLNALTLACNQATSREPVMALSEQSVRVALDDLKALRLVRFVLPSHGKSVTRYRHVFDEVYGLNSSQVAGLSVLLLRGPQTSGELRARIGRMATFESVGVLQEILEGLSERPEPLVRLLPRRQGQKEDRWQQLVAVEITEVGTAGSEHAVVPEHAFAPGPADVPSTLGSDPDSDTGQHTADLEMRIEVLQSELAALRAQIAELASSLNALRESLGE